MSERLMCDNPGELPRRPYGTGGIELSVIGLGGMLLMGEDQRTVDRLVAEAIERGVNHFDVAPQYGDAEERLGPALAPHRERVFLACKTLERGREGADKELRRSLERLRTDHLDLYQLHALSDVKEDLDVALGKGGAIETFAEAKRSGIIRHIGFSAHSAEVALAALERFEFDSILYPINFATFHQSDQGPRVLAAALQRGVSVLALKSLAREPWPEGSPERDRHPKCWYRPITDRREADLALRFTLDFPVTVAIPPGEPALLRMALDIACDLQPLTEAESVEIQRLAQSVSVFLEAV